jgi:hypothetical protein
MLSGHVLDLEVHAVNLADVSGRQTLECWEFGEASGQ